MSENDFLKSLQSNLTKAVITIVLAFIGTVVTTIFASRANTADINELKAVKADKETVQHEFEGLEKQLDQIQQDIRSGQEILIDLLRQ